MKARNALVEIVMVPALQAVFTGCLGALVTVGVCWLFGWNRAWVWGFVVGAVVAFTSWLKFSEPVAPAEPRKEQQEPPDAFRLEIDYDSGRAGDFLTFGVPLDTFTSWCSSVARGGSLAEDVWCGSTGIFSKGQYHVFREQLLARGFVVPRGRHHSQGFTLSKKGLAMTRGVLARAHPHAPTTSTKQAVVG